MSLTTELKVEPAPLLDRELQLEVDTELRALQDVQDEIKMLTSIALGHKERIWNVLRRTGEKSVKYNQWTITEVRGDSSKLVILELKKQGVTDAQIKAATKTSPKKAYVLITEGDQLLEDQS